MTMPSAMRVVPSLHPDDALVGCPVCGRDACEDHLTQPPAQTKSKLQVRRAVDLLVEADPREIVERVAYAGCVTVIVSESGAGKTFLLLDLSAAVSAGVLWHGRATQQGSVLYFAFEGDALRSRIRALIEVQGYRLDHVYVVRVTDPISPRLPRDGGEEPSVGERLMADCARHGIVITCSTPS